MNTKDLYGVRNYKTSEKTRRPLKSTLDKEKIEKRNSRQKNFYVNLENINEIFSDNEKWPVCYDMLFNLIQGKVTKFFATRNYDRKKEVSYDCINRLYSILKRKLLRMKSEGIENPTLNFFLSQFFRYIELVVYSTVYHGTQDQKYIVQEPENFVTENVLHNQENGYYQFEEESEFFSDKKYQNDLTSGLIEANIEKDDYEEELEKYLQNSENTIEDFIADNSEQIKLCIENNTKLDNKEKSALFRLYRSCYSKYGLSALTKRDQDIIRILSLRIEYEPDLLGDLKEILDGKRKSTEN